MIKIGEQAPNFALEGFYKGHIKKYELKDFKGKWLVIFFYPLDFTFVCPTEIKEFSARYREFKKLNAEVLGVSVDSVHSHRAWVEGSLGPLNFPLLSDFHKKMSPLSLIPTARYNTRFIAQMMSADQ
jgi:alkyl hydroperoxide reductase subunit AhpC